MKNENYINIQGWMINELKLKGNELILYALIYGFTQDGKHKYRGSIKYIMEALKLSNKGVINLINKLIEKKLIEKSIKVTGNEYNAVHVKKVHSEKSSPVKKVHRKVCKKFTSACEQSSHNINKDNNNNNNNIANISIEDVCEPQQTYKTKEKIYKQKGLEYKKPKRTNKQQQTLYGLMLIQYFKQEAHNKGYEYLSDLKIKDKVQDLSNRNKKIRKVFIKAMDHYDYRTAREHIDWYLMEGGEYCNFAPDACFSMALIEKFKNKDNNPNRGILKA
jgi:hypothetical protein